jgi:hypothetical protein
MQRWSAEHRGFAVETYLKTNEFVVLTQPIFRQHFNIYLNDIAPSRIIVSEFETSAKQRVLRKEHILEDSLLLELLRTSNEGFRLLSEALGDRQSEMPLALRMSDRTVGPMLHQDLNFHPYKMVMVEALNDQDTKSKNGL